MIATVQAQDSIDSLLDDKEDDGDEHSPNKGVVGRLSITQHVLCYRQHIGLETIKPAKRE